MSRDADVLNRLIAGLRSASAGYRKAGADGPGLSDVFGGAAESHDRTAESLAAVVRAMGAETSAPAPDGSQAWTHLPRAVAEGPRTTAETVERIEAELLRDLRAALDDAEVSEPVREVVTDLLPGVKAGHDRTIQRLRALEA